MTLSITDRGSKKRPTSVAALFAVVVSLAACSNDVASANATPAATAGIVFIDDGSKQCQSITADISHFTKQLQNADVDVRGQYCGQITGTYYPAVCGAKNGKIYVFAVDDVASAKALGFSEAAGLPDGQGIMERPCPKVGQPAKIRL